MEPNRYPVVNTMNLFAMLEVRSGCFCFLYGIDPAVFYLIRHGLVNCPENCTRPPVPASVIISAYTAPLAPQEVPDDIQVPDRSSPLRIHDPENV